MADELHTPPNGATPPTAPVTPPVEPPTPAERTFTQDEVNRIAANVRSEEKTKYESKLAQMKPEPVTPPVKPDPGPEKPPTIEQLQQQIADLNMGRAFDAAVSGLTLTDAQRGALETLYRNAAPDDARQWATSTAESLGFTTAASPPTDAPPADPVSPTEPPASDRGAPSSPRDPSRFLNPNELTQDDIARIYAEHGVVKGRRMIRERAEQWYRNRPVVPERRH